MPRPDREEIQTSDPTLSIVICDDGSRTLKCNQRRITWHSESGALAESQLVFLENSGIEQRLKEPDSHSRVLEVGLGTGLNFWLTASMALKNSANLTYFAFEPNPLPADLIDQLEYGKLEACQPAAQIFSKLRIGSTIAADVCLNVFEQSIEDNKLKEDIFDAIYHDPFSPEAAPQLWTEPLFSKLLGSLKPGGKLVTYCVKSEIQRRLSNVGFEVSKTKGPQGGKREVLVATRGQK